MMTGESLDSCEVMAVKTKTVSARVSVEFYERVRREAEKRGETVSDVVRKALERELKPWWRFW